MQDDVFEAPFNYQRRPIRRTLQALSRLLMAIDQQLRRPRLKPVAIVFFSTVTLASVIIYISSPWFEFVLNKSESMPGVVYFLDKTTRPECGDTTVFRMPAQARFYKGARLIKIIKGCPGDVITVQNHEVFLNGKSVGKYSDFTTVRHKPLYPVSTGIIPPGKVYLYAPHPRSFDSRYLSYGLRDRSELLGTATRIF